MIIQWLLAMTQWVLMVRLRKRNRMVLSERPILDVSPVQPAKIISKFKKLILNVLARELAARLTRIWNQVA